MLKSEDFFVWLERYYGRYARTELRNTVAAYIRDIPEQEFVPLKAHLIRTFSTQYNFTPDVATLEVARSDIKPAPRAQAYQLKAPDPEARDMKVEVGQLMEIVLMKVAKNKQARERQV